MHDTEATVFDLNIKYSALNQALSFEMSSKFWLPSFSGESFYFTLLSMVNPTQAIRVWGCQSVIMFFY